MSKIKIFPELTDLEEEALKEEAQLRGTDDLHYLAKHILGYDKVTDHYHKRMAVDIDTPRYRFKLLLHPRGHYKSTIGTESRAIQKLLRDAKERILITNAKLGNSQKFLRTISSHFKDNFKFRWIYRDWWLQKYATSHHKEQFKEKLDWVTRDTVDEFTVLRPSGIREASITTGSTEASLVSQHYSTIIADDLINRDFVRTIDMVEKSVLYFKDLLDLLDPDGDLEIIGTRWSHYDLYSWIIEEFGGIASLRVPKDFVSEDIRKKAEDTSDEKKEWMVSIQPVFKEDGSPVFPEEFNDKVLTNLKNAKGPYEFGAQYLLNPTPKEDQKFKEEWFNKLDTLPSVSDMQVCITVDPAKSLEDKADNTAIVVCGYDKYNKMYLLDGRDEHLDIEDVPEVIFQLVRHWLPRCRFMLPMGFEAVGFQETYVYNLERKMREENFFFVIEPIKRRVQSKHERILRMVPRVKNGFYVPRRLMVNPYRGGPEYDLTQRLMWQLTMFPFAGKDDVADAIADQLDIVQSNMLPTEKVVNEKVITPDFTHRSILEDKGKRSRGKQYNDAVR